MAAFEELAALDRLIHEPARLAILTALSACGSADFLFLQRLTGLTKGNLSTHLAKLAEAGIVEIDKGYIGKIPNTKVQLSDSGRLAVEQHWLRLARLHSEASQWRAPE
jgi:DNA-binding transcriptional ArsR family regulator